MSWRCCWHTWTGRVMIGLRRWVYNRAICGFAFTASANDWKSWQASRPPAQGNLETNAGVLVIIGLGEESRNGTAGKRGANRPLSPQSVGTTGASPAIK